MVIAPTAAAADGRAGSGTAGGGGSSTTSGQPSKATVQVEYRGRQIQVICR